MDTLDEIFGRTHTRKRPDFYGDREWAHQARSAHRSYRIEQAIIERNARECGTGVSAEEFCLGQLDPEPILPPMAFLDTLERFFGDG